MNPRAGGGVNRSQQSTRPLPDDDIYAIAERIRSAVLLRGRDPADLEILSMRSELPPCDEDRVIIALTVLQLLEDIGA